MQQRQTARNKATRREHNKTFAQPKRDSRQMIIPHGTITEVEGPKFSLPFRYLRTWIFSLLALLAIPIGLMLLFIGAEMEEDAPNWQETTATIVEVNEEGIRYEIESLDNKNSGSFSFVLDDFIDLPAGAIEIQLSACDLVNRFIVPQESGAEFSIWVNPERSSQRSCVPISSDMAIAYTSIATLLLFFSAWQLVRTIHQAGLQPKQVQQI
jgi:hypothetical protein